MKPFLAVFWRPREGSFGSHDFDHLFKLHAFADSIKVCKSDLRLCGGDLRLCGGDLGLCGGKFSYGGFFGAIPFGRLLGVAIVYHDVRDDSDYGQSNTNGNDSSEHGGANMNVKATALVDGGVRHGNNLLMSLLLDLSSS